ncbi:hypothetical protein Ciccas_006847 [Cichlidogyrus casuarinus]|uniref:Ig-like domain-containing protein n=1 Tax=Cichlidogyrus casuarinus TaxID=1844966 RepID=A0ABD2Q5U6_9PLAT
MNIIEFLLLWQATSHLLIGRMKPLLHRQSKTDFEGTQETNIAVLSGPHSEIMLECVFASNPAPNISWFRDDQLLDLNSPSSYQNSVKADTKQDASLPYQTVAKLSVASQSLNEYWLLGGEYRAEATNEYGTGACKTIVLVRGVGLRMRPSGQGLRYPNYREETAIDGRLFTLKCYAIGPELPTLSWLKISNNANLTIPLDHRHQLFERNRVLKFVTVNNQDSGEYECQAKLPNSDDTVVKSIIKLTVKNAPTIKQGMKEHNSNQGERFYAGCVPISADEPWYAWWEFLPEGSQHPIRIRPLTTDLGIDITYSQDGAKSQLIVPQVLHSVLPDFVMDHPNQIVNLNIKSLDKSRHVGQVTCVIRNTVDEARESVKLRFNPEFEFAKRPPNNLQVTLNQTIAIDCQPRKTDVEARVDWQFQGSLIPHRLMPSPLTQQRTLKGHR